MLSNTGLTHRLERPAGERVAQVELDACRPFVASSLAAPARPSGWNCQVPSSIENGPSTSCTTTERAGTCVLRVVKAWCTPA